jgi:hypothetical protein
MPNKEKTKKVQEKAKTRTISGRKFTELKETPKKIEAKDAATQARVKGGHRARVMPAKTEHKVVSRWATWADGLRERKARKEELKLIKKETRARGAEWKKETKKQAELRKERKEIKAKEKAKKESKKEKVRQARRYKTESLNREYQAAVSEMKEFGMEPMSKKEWLAERREYEKLQKENRPKYRNVKSSKLQRRELAHSGHAGLEYQAENYGIDPDLTIDENAAELQRQLREQAFT